ncbi:hypothetical protein ACJX0J_006424, partial [Zea mays]
YDEANTFLYRETMNDHHKIFILLLSCFAMKGKYFHDVSIMLVEREDISGSQRAGKGGLVNQFGEPDDLWLEAIEATCDEMKKNIAEKDAEDESTRIAFGNLWLEKDNIFISLLEYKKNSPPGFHLF